MTEKAKKKKAVREVSRWKSGSIQVSHGYLDKETLAKKINNVVNDAITYRLIG
jgi:hypothetical protein